MNHMESNDPVASTNGRAIVMGGSMAGLLAARVLSERFAEVLILERDELPDMPAPREGTPHAGHAHGLLARGREVLEELFPGYTRALEARGAVVGDVHSDLGFLVAGRPFAAGTGGTLGVACSRALIEDELRRRVRALPNVRIRCRVDVVEPHYDAGRECVTGVRIRRKDADANGACDEETLPAELIVDTTGRGSRAPAWLARWGFDPPEEERVSVGIGYATAYYERTPEHVSSRAGAVLAATAEHPYPGVLLAQECVSDGHGAGVDRWVVTFGGYAGDHPEASPEGMRRRALATGSEDAVRVTHGARMLTGVTRYGFPHSQRRHYERLKRFPGGFLVLGDALASFNPIYGQGMTVAACESLALRNAIAVGGRGAHRLFFTAAARIVDIPWQLAVGADLEIPVVDGPRPLSARCVNAYLRRLFRAAERDAAVSRAFTRVMHLLATPAALFAPNIALRVLWQNVRYRPPSIGERGRAMLRVLLASRLKPARSD